MKSTDDASAAVSGGTGGAGETVPGSKEWREMYPGTAQALVAIEARIGRIRSQKLCRSREGRVVLAKETAAALRRMDDARERPRTEAEAITREKRAALRARALMEAARKKAEQAGQGRGTASTGKKSR